MFLISFQVLLMLLSLDHVLSSKDRAGIGGRSSRPEFQLCEWPRTRHRLSETQGFLNDSKGRPWARPSPVLQCSGSATVAERIYWAALCSSLEPRKGCCCLWALEVVPSALTTGRFSRFVHHVGAVWPASPLRLHACRPGFMLFKRHTERQSRPMACGGEGGRLSQKEKQEKTPEHEQQYGDYSGERGWCR